MSQKEGLTLRASGRVAGRLTQSETGAALFHYDSEWLRLDGAYPLSLSLPLQVEPHRGAAVSNWLEGLLPFGGLGAQVAALTGQSQATGLLARLGGDAPGAYRFGEPDAQSPGLRPVKDLSAFLKRWESDPLLLGMAGVSHSLAEDSADRLPVCLIESEAGPQIAIAMYGAPSTHILWREPEKTMGALENRAFHLALGGAVGLSVAGFRVIEAGKARLLLTLRDDREQRGGGWVRLHRESLAQAMGASVEDRYGRDPGPFSDLESIFQWADGALAATERLRLLDAFLFNALIGAPDAHLLRYALRLQPAPALAPLTELAGPGLAPPKERRFPQRIGGAARWPERITAEQWRAFASAAKLNSTFTVDRLLELAEAIVANAEPVAERLEEEPALQRAILGRFAREAKERAGDAIKRLSR